MAQIALRNKDLQKTRYWLGQAVELALAAEEWPIAVRSQRALANLMRAQGDFPGAKARLLTLAQDADQLELPVESAA